MAVAIAHPNIALSKYWGKWPGPGNYPAVPSLSVTLKGMKTETEVCFREELSCDRLVLAGEELSGIPLERVKELLNRVRAVSGENRFAEVRTNNDFPTGSGLASSASGFAALALAAAHAAGLSYTREWVGDLARQSSVSAARSIIGGFVELTAGPPSAEREGEEGLLAAIQVAPPDYLDLYMLVCVVTEAPKLISSTEGMRVTASKSPFYRAWLEVAPALHERIHRALLACDICQLGEAVETSALAMHASALAAGIFYWSPVTFSVLEAVRSLREKGWLAYATIDAGPHVKVLTGSKHLSFVKQSLEALHGVQRVLETCPGEGAQLVSPLI
ncbi:diphosphomevalonate decarboxylase [Pajaroellobacter abortibovis]|uniref:diphosphomevalonate decarboxylase n=2 Tax=Pajaroellobacter abortibovis TaxID=1882918 RepID=A0A1L6MXV3_9BACT|nr:diphosphomevalonate decarboxylase [Pajaroellobacter abortibovis]